MYAMHGADRNIYDPGYLFPGAVVDVTVAQDKLLVMVGEEIDPFAYIIPQGYEDSDLLLDVTLYLVYLFKTFHERCLGRSVRVSRHPVIIDAGDTA